MTDSVKDAEATSTADPDLLFELERPGYRLRLRLQNEQMVCCADLEFITPAEPEPEDADSASEVPAESVESERRLPELPIEAEAKSEIFTPDELIKLLKQCDINSTIDFAALYDFCAAAAEGVSQQSVMLAKGVEPVAGEDGWFELAVKVSGEETEFEEDEHGNVDLRTLHAYSEIEPEQKLGTVHPPKDGQPGMTAHGLPIPAEKGKPFDLIAGEGVVLKYDNRLAFAEKEGRALLEKQTLRVVDEFIVSGNVDLHIGHIDFHGFVEIKGDVLDDFNIKASRGLRVAGVVGACHIESGGSMEITSMAGKESGEIICHGDLIAGYLNQVSVQCYGNIYVRKEIRNSQIKATGSIVVESGSIIGGKCVALEGIEAKVMGTTSGQKTYLAAGTYFPDADRFDYLREKLRNINRQLKLIHKALGPLERVNDLGDALDKASELRLSILNQQWEKLEQEKEQFSSELAASKPQEFSSCNPKINVVKALKEGVVISLGNATEEIKIELSGPLTLIENTGRGGLRHLSFTPLPEIAAELEAEILEEETEKQ